jgi:excisionase family DNA binding protein
MTTSGPALEAILEQIVERVARRVVELQRDLQPNTVDERSPWMGIHKAAEYVDWPKQRLYKLTASGAIPHYKHEGRLLFHRAELDQWLAHHAQPIAGFASSGDASYPSSARLQTG